MIGAPINGITMSNGCVGEVVIVTEPADWYAIESHLGEPEKVYRSDLMPGEKKVLGSLRKGCRLSWPLKRCRKMMNIFLYIGDDASLMERPEVWR